MNTSNENILSEDINSRSKIDIHADDYALTPNTSKEMLELMREGLLNSVSIIANMSCFEECMEMLKDAIPTLPFLPLMSVHVNLVEGRVTCEGDMPEAIIKQCGNSVTSSEISTKTSEPRLLNLSWGRLYLYSYILGRKNPVRIAIENEVKAQVVKCQNAIRECIQIAADNGIRCDQKGLRIDSHQHTHMIPMVWNACIKASEDMEEPLEYIRNSHEMLGVFLKNGQLLRTYRPVNIVKNRILALHSGKADRLCDKKGLDKMYLWGLIMSGRMDKDRIEALISDVRAYSDKNNRCLEILFHPGTTLPEEVTEELNADAVRDFYESSGRAAENEAVRSIKSIMSLK